MRALFTNPSVCLRVCLCAGDDSKTRLRLFFTLEKNVQVIPVSNKPQNSNL